MNFKKIKEKNKLLKFFLFENLIKTTIFLFWFFKNKISSVSHPPSNHSRCSSNKDSLSPFVKWPSLFAIPSNLTFINSSILMLFTIKTDNFYLNKLDWLLMSMKLFFFYIFKYVICIKCNYFVVIVIKTYSQRLYF